MKTNHAVTFLLAFVGFTDPVGHIVYVAPSEVAAVTGPGGCNENAKTKIAFGGNNAFVCVQEPIEEVVRRLAGRD